MYADDLVVLDDSLEELHFAIVSVELYEESW